MNYPDLTAIHPEASDIRKLAPDQQFRVLCKLLPSMDAKELLHFAPVLAAVIPELAPTIGFDQRSPHHAYDLFTHIAFVTASVPKDPLLRWAGLLHDVGKVPTFTTDKTGRGHFYGHAPESARMADRILSRMDAPTCFREQVVQLIGLHMTKIDPDDHSVRRWLHRLGGETLERLLQLQEADMGSKGTGDPAEMEQFPHLRRVIAKMEAK